MIPKMVKNQPGSGQYSQIKSKVKILYNFRKINKCFEVKASSVRIKKTF